LSLEVGDVGEIGGTTLSLGVAEGEGEEAGVT